MTVNFTPLDKETLAELTPAERAPHLNKVLFGIATITALIFAVTVSVLLQQRAQAQNTITLPPVEITVEE